MTADTMLSTAPAAPAGKPKTRRMSTPKILLIISGVLIGLSLVHWLTGADDVTSQGAIQAALQAAIPLGLAGLGGLWSERAGVVNIGLEGQLILGTWFGAWGSIEFGPWVGLLLGVLGGAVGGLVHAVATVTFGVDHIISGVAMTILAPGLARYLSFLAWSDTPGAGATQSPTAQRLPRVSVPFVDDLAGLERKQWFLLSDVAGVLRGLLVDVSIVTILAVLLIPLSWWLLWRTSFGLRVRSVGEDPHAAESLGINVYLYKYYGVIISGAMAGLGGVFLSTVSSAIYREGQTGGRGYIGLAAMIFGNWRPGGLALGASLFGYTDALQLRRGSESVHALLILVGALLLALAVWEFRRRNRVVAISSAVLGVLSYVLFFSVDKIPTALVQAAPYITVLVVLALAAQRLRPPAADGKPYRRGG
ncbi:ABC transporter permease [Dactylosporangium sucinum]|uniref:ABC transporter permease n=1 Tax=Dactylosporangium sucinum TaxID=1424081 RepID=A0A917WTY3_9ACTN|nr:ABC transporter permease [Dactylosporangium sucinum]GGM32043.1 ABC transporter permease [Dactylosporangium sucinum]